MEPEGQMTTLDELDTHSYEMGYADGFDRGEEAIVQQVDAILDAAKPAYEKVRKIRDLIARFWKARES